jgi:hypothetical protein
MNNKRYKNVTVLLGAFFLASLLVNLIQILMHNPKNLIDMFKFTNEVGLPWIAYISIMTIFLSALGAVGLMKYRQWGFYGIYLAYLAAISIAWFPFFPGFIFQFTSGVYKSIITLIVLFTLLALLIYLHQAGKKRLYFKKSTAL